MKLTKTAFIGIYIGLENGYYWIMDDNGNDEFFGRTMPTASDVLVYRNREVSW